MLICAVCKKEILEPTKNQKDGFRRRGRTYCSVECRKEYMRKISSETMSKTNKKYASERMKKNNPMKNLEVRQKMSDTLKRIGHKPKIRWGNGCGLTVPQENLMNALNEFYPKAEYAVSTKGYIGKYPDNYKIDIAIPNKKIAIEVDGNSHYALSRQAEDKKKTEILELMGWKVLRFWNKQVNENIGNCVQQIKEVINK